MTEKEFSKLKRHELLQLLLAQGRETKQLEEQLADINGRFQELEEGYERLKGRLNEKDAQIEHLIERLDNKDRQIRGLKETLESERASRELQLDKAGSIAEAALQLNGIFEVAQKAADQYVENIRLRYRNVENEIIWRQQECRRNCEALEAKTKMECDLLLKSAREKYAEQERKIHE